MKTEIKVISGNWVSGKLGTMEFQAKIFTEPSDYGILNGRVSKLSVADVLNYDRGWDFGKDKKKVWGPIVKLLEAFAQTPEFAESLEPESGHTEPEETCECRK